MKARGIGALVLSAAATAVINALKDPKTRDEILALFNSLRGASSPKPAEMLSVLTTLKNEITYLEFAAGSESELAQVRAWAKRIDQLHHAVNVACAPGTPMKHLKVLRKKVNTLQAEIFAKYVEEKAEESEKKARITAHGEGTTKTS